MSTDMKACAHCQGPVRKDHNIYCSICCYAKHRTRDVADRFWSFVDVRDDDECWTWIGGTSKGYGTFQATIDGKRYSRASRVSWALANGDPGDLFVCHHCDNSMCVNPRHMFLGTDLDNKRDMWNKGRQSPPPIALGEKHHFAKMTPESVAEMRARRVAGESINSLAKVFGISVAAARAIIIRKSWAHVP